MYGPVSATLRRLGVRQAPFNGSSGDAVRARASAAARIGSPSSALSLQTEARENLPEASLPKPSQAPQGKHFTPFTQSQAALPAAHSPTVGTSGPLWGTPMSWKSPSENRGPAWQSTHTALPTNSRAPRFAAGEMASDAAPSATKRSNGAGAGTSWA